VNPSLDLTGFGFTPTESLVYGVLVRGGPGTGYAIARSAGLARANAYSALEGLVQKGAARVEEGRPRRFRPEPPSALIARIIDRQAQDLDALTQALDEISVPPSPTLVELGSSRGVLHILSHEIARAERWLRLIAPADAFPPLVPVLRKAASSGVDLDLASPGSVALPFASVAVIGDMPSWPGEPVLFSVDGRGAAIAARRGDSASGHWGTDPILIAAADILFERFRGVAR
jgi:sugar-specific transcriptional regulator TrmB